MDLSYELTIKFKDLHLLTIMGPYCKVLPHII